MRELREGYFGNNQKSGAALEIEKTQSGRRDLPPKKPFFFFFFASRLCSALLGLGLGLESGFSLSGPGVGVVVLPLFVKLCLLSDLFSSSPRGPCMVCILLRTTAFQTSESSSKPQSSLLVSMKKITERSLQMKTSKARKIILVHRSFK